MSWGHIPIAKEIRLTPVCIYSRSIRYVGLDIDDAYIVASIISRLKDRSLDVRLLDARNRCRQLTAHYNIYRRHIVYSTNA